MLIRGCVCLVSTGAASGDGESRTQKEGGNVVSEDVANLIIGLGTLVDDIHGCYLVVPVERVLKALEDLLVAPEEIRELEAILAPFLA